MKKRSLFLPILFLVSYHSFSQGIGATMPDVTTGNKSQAVIKVFDSGEALVKVQKETLLQGNNQLRVDIRSLANGTYSFYIDWNNGQMKKTMQVLKQ